MSVSSATVGSDSSLNGHPPPAGGVSSRGWKTDHTVPSGVRRRPQTTKLPAWWPTVRSTRNAFRWLINKSHERIPQVKAWWISLTFHVAVLLLLALLNWSIPGPKSMSFELRQAEEPGVAEPAFTIESAAIPSIAMSFDRPADEVQAELSLELSPAPLPNLSPATEPQPVNLSVPSLSAILDHPPLQEDPRADVPPPESDGQPGGSGNKIADMFTGRSGPTRDDLLRRYGGTAETESAVELGLEWLKRNQLYNGSWSLSGPYSAGSPFENNIAATSMAMLAFMGAGHTHREGQYKDEMQRAVNWLLAQQLDDGSLRTVAIDDAHRAYAQAQATIALCELYAMTNDYRLRPPAQKACDYAVAWQSELGGWRYRPQVDADASVTGWFVMALKSGQSAQLVVDDEVLPRVEGFLNSLQGERYSGTYGYQPGDRASPAMTAECLLCREYLGWRRQRPELQAGLELLVESHPIEVDDQDVYYWYYATQALHHFGGELWDEWNERLKTVVPALQVQKGPERGSWPPQMDAWGREAGRLYTTCLSIYCLEVYYRHMPLYDPDKVESASNLLLP